MTHGTLFLKKVITAIRDWLNWHTFLRFWQMSKTSETLFRWPAMAGSGSRAGARTDPESTGAPVSPAEAAGAAAAADTNKTNSSQQVKLVKEPENNSEISSPAIAKGYTSQ